MRVRISLADSIVQYASQDKPPSQVMVRRPFQSHHVGLSVFPFVPRSLARRGFARSRASKAAASPDCSAAKAAMNGSVAAVAGFAAKQVHAACQVVPGFEAVLPGVNQSGILLREGSLSNLLVAPIGETRVPFSNLLERRRTRRMPRSQQTVNAVGNPGHIRDEQSRVAGMRRRLGVGLELGPTGEPLFTSEHELRIVQSHKLAHGCFVQRRPAACWRRRRESASAFPDRIARKSSRACFFCCSRFKTSSFVCLVRMTGERGSTKEGCLKEQVGAALSADRTRPARV